MDRKVFWDRRCGIDRRQLHGYDVTQRRTVDRRQLPSNGYMLVIGSSGLDTFELLILAPIITVVASMMIGNYIGSF